MHGQPDLPKGPLLAEDKLRVKHGGGVWLWLNGRGASKRPKDDECGEQHESEEGAVVLWWSAPFPYA